MTMQTSDRIQYMDKEYDIIDISKGAKFIDPVDYQRNNMEDIYICSACWRGYEVYLKVINEQLLLRIFNGRRMRQDLNFTGSMIIARENAGQYNTDFLETVFLFKDVKELIFKDGKLMDENDLSDKLREYNTETKTDGGWCNTERENFIRGLCVGKFEQ